MPSGRVNLHTALADLPQHTFTVESTTLTEQIANHLRDYPELPGVVVLRDPDIAMISRQRFFEQLGQRYGVAVFLGRSVQLMLETLDQQSLVLSAETTVSHAMQQALRRPRHATYDPIVIRYASERYTLLDSHELLIAHSQIFIQLEQGLKQANHDLEIRYQQAQEQTAQITRSKEALELISEIGQRLTAILDLETLLTTLVNQLRDRLELYHVHVYLLNPNGEQLDMLAGSGNIGRQLKDKQHKLELGQGMVGTVASSKEMLLSNNVAQEPHFFRNPLLPHTQSELALPLLKGEKLLGVLDIQSERRNGFSPDEVMMLQSVANQAAIAVDNAQLLAEEKRTIAKLKEMDRLKSQFLTMMSHELRTPMNGILGFAEILLLGISGDLSEEAQNDLQLIYDNAKHLLGIINNILDVAKLESGLAPIKFRPIEVHPFVNEVVTTASKVFLKNSNVGLKSELPEELPYIKADYNRLKQVMLNLLSNAIKFTPSGMITVTANLSPDDPTYLRFAVTDTGIGIPQEKQSLIFELFKQGDMSDTRAYGGTGLGLTICKELLELHHGTIGVNSQAGVGSEFYFTIPIIELGELELFG